jgi:hypothetical protein
MTKSIIAADNVAAAIHAMMVARPGEGEPTQLTANLQMRPEFGVVQIAEAAAHL